jgi:hypothetical protein
VTKDVRLAFQLKEAGFFEGLRGEALEHHGQDARSPNLEELLEGSKAQFGSLEYRHGVKEWVVLDKYGVECTFGQSAWDAVARFWLNSRRQLDSQSSTFLAPR